MNKYLKLLRVKHYVKNLFIFLPIIFSGNLFNVSLLTNLLFTFILFSLVASCTYIFNDIRDIEQDKLHPKKSLRPIASGEISIKNASIIMTILLFTVLIAGFYFNKLLFGLLLFYFLLNIAYSMCLKQYSIIDICIITIGFILRILTGCVIINIEPSEYLIIMTFLLSLFIAFAKRYDDINYSQQGKTVRTSIGKYNKDFVLISMAVLASVNIVTYILYTLSLKVQSQFHYNYIYLSSFFVIIGFIRYLQLTFVDNNSGSPTNIFYKDKFILITVILWFLFLFICLYF